MNIKIINVSVQIIVILILIILSSFGGNYSNNENVWIAPNEANNAINPLKGNSSSILEGKKIFTQMCNVCHGDKGKGDGIAAAGLTPHPANFTVERICGETDGAIYWKMTTGKAPMASYKEILSDEKRWGLVNYIRQLQANAKQKNN
jgi:cytochrome c